MTENIKTVIDLYKKGKVTEYVLEKEFASFIGDHVACKIVVDANNSNETYVVFAVPEKKVEGFYTTFIFDKQAIFTLYDEDELFAILLKLKEKKYAISKKYNDFLIEKGNTEITFNDAMGFLLSLYSTYRNDLAFKNAELLPNEDEILKIAEKYIVGEATQEDTENLLVKHYISYYIIAYIEKYVNQNAKFVINPDQPRNDDLQNEISAFCKGQTYVPFGHVELPYNYKPTTNQ